jgi:ATP synthase protein I
MPTDPAPNQFIRYAGLAFQMLFIIGVGAWAGIWLDGYLKTHTPWFTIGGSLGGLGVALYQVIRSLTRNE